MWSVYDVGQEVSSVSRYFLCFLARILFVSVPGEVYCEEKPFVSPYLFMTPVETKVQYRITMKIR